MSATEKKQVTLTGTPAEIGGQIWERYCLPAVRRMSNEAPPVALQQLYVGFMSAAIGAMAADFGYEHAVLLAQRMVDSISSMADELPESLPH